MGSGRCYNTRAWYKETLKFQKDLHACNIVSDSGTGHPKRSCRVLPADGGLPWPVAGDAQHTSPRGIRSPFISLNHVQGAATHKTAPQVFAGQDSYFLLLWYREELCSMCSPGVTDDIFRHRTICRKTFWGASAICTKNEEWNSALC